LLSSLFKVFSFRLLLKRDLINAYSEMNSRKSPTKKGIRPGPGLRNSPKPILREKNMMKRLKRIQNMIGMRDLSIIGGNPAVHIFEGAKLQPKDR